MSYRVRRRETGDLGSIVSIMRDSFPQWWKRLPYLCFPTLVICKEDALAGFVVIVVRHNMGEIGIIAVDRRYRRENVGAVLLQGAINYLEKRGIFCCTGKVRVGNEAARGLFQKIGFRKVKLLHRPVLGDVYLMKREAEHQ